MDIWKSAPCADQQARFARPVDKAIGQADGQLTLPTSLTTALTTGKPAFPTYPQAHTNHQSDQKHSQNQNNTGRTKSWPKGLFYNCVFVARNDENDGK